MDVDSLWLTNLLGSIGSLCTQIVGKLLLAAAVLLAGRVLIKWLLKLTNKCEAVMNMDESVRSITTSVVSIALYVLLIVSVVGILGVPMASVTAVIAAAAAAVGLALQGTLSSFAAGIEILVFRPFRIGDYISAAGTEGTVKDISIFFTVLVTVDNKRVTIPNSSVMGGIITNYTAEGTRRVEVGFQAPYAADNAKVLDIMTAAAQGHALVLNAPEAPYARISGAADGVKEYIVRAWCRSEDYWTVYFELLEGIGGALAAAGVQPGVKHYVIENKQD